MRRGARSRSSTRRLHAGLGRGRDDLLLRCRFGLSDRDDGSGRRRDVVIRRRVHRYSLRKHRCRLRSGRRLHGGRRGRRCGRGWGGGRRRGCRGRAGGAPRREQAEWVDVRVAVADPNAEVDVGRVVLRLAGGARIGDRISLADHVAFPDAQRAEMRERGPVAVRGHDRDGEAVRRYLAGERHLSRGRRANRRCATECDVDAAMLARGVLVALDGELSED
jgi:hypothetical protein